MSWFIAGITLHALGIALIAANALYDAFQSPSADNTSLNLLGMVLAVVLVIAFCLKNAGMTTAANVLLWVPGFPMFLLFLFYGFYLVVSWFSDTGWQ